MYSFGDKYDIGALRDCTADLFFEHILSTSGVTELLGFILAIYESVGFRECVLRKIGVEKFTKYPKRMLMPDNKKVVLDFLNGNQDLHENLFEWFMKHIVSTSEDEITNQGTTESDDV